jgi:hypothetical protein
MKCYPEHNLYNIREEEDQYLFSDAHREGIPFDL